MSALPARPNLSTSPRFNCGSCSIDSIGRRHGEVIEVHVAVGLGPQADSSRNRLGQDMLQVELAVEIGRDLGPGDADLEVVPLAGLGWGIADTIYPVARFFLQFSQQPTCLPW